VKKTLMLALALAAAAGCRQSRVGTFGGAPVVIISIDTLRADHLSAYGYTSGRTPVLDAFAQEAVVFDAIYSQAPTTLPSHASLLTGLLPPRTGVRDNIGYALDAAHPTLASRFKRAGYRTGGAVSAYVLRSQAGLGQGFEFFDDALEIGGPTESVGAIQRDGAVAVASLSRWVTDHADGAFFAFLHLYEPHTPYAPPPAYRSLASPYDGEIAYADELVGRFLGRLKALGAYDKAVIAVVSDHGEGLGDHGEAEHGMFLYREALHVPLLLRLPGGLRGGTRPTGTAGLVDLSATFLDLTGLRADDLDGVSLRPAIEGRDEGSRRVYSETLYPRLHFGWADLYAATEGRLRYIHAPRPELFDLGQDPAEKKNLVASRASEVASMRAWVERHRGEVKSPDDVPPDVLQKLQALGYVGVGGGVVAAEGDLPDPKDKIGAYEDFRRAITLHHEKRDAEAIEQLEEVLADNPRIVDAWELLGTTLLRDGRSAEGLKALDQVLEIDPTRASTHLALARYYALERKPQLARKHAELAIEKSPGQGYEVLAQIMMDLRQPALAEEFARRSLAKDDQSTMSHFVLGVLAQQKGRYDEALAAFRRAEATLERRKHLVVRDLHAKMGDCLAHLGRDQEAEQEFRAELAQIPASREARVGLALLYRSQGRDAETREVLAGVVAGDAGADADAYWTVVRTFAALGDREATLLWAGRARARFPDDPRFGARSR
jgi:arylsulfatase A-like enzyme/Tfp pilus assembly protein PilF